MLHFFNNIKKKNFLFSFRKVVAVVMLSPLLLMAIYLVVAAICIFFPTGRYFKQSEEKIEVSIYVGLIHTSFILPIRNEYFDFGKYVSPENAQKYKYIALGWGDRDYFLQTPTWNEFRIGTAFNALFRSAGSVIHIEYFEKMPTGSDYYLLRLPGNKYAQLVNYLTQSFKYDENGKARELIGHVYYGDDEFYESKNNFDLFHTCNIWTSNALKRINYKTAFWSPLPWGIEYYLRR